MRQQVRIWEHFRRGNARSDKQKAQLSRPRRQGLAWQQWLDQNESRFGGTVMQAIP